MQILFGTLLHVFSLAYVASYKPFKSSWRNHLEVINICTVLVCFMTLFPFVFYDHSDYTFYECAKVAAGFILFFILLNVILMSTYYLFDLCKFRNTSPAFVPPPEKEVEEDPEEMKKEWEEMNEDELAD